MEVGGGLCGPKRLAQGFQIGKVVSLKLFSDLLEQFHRFRGVQAFSTVQTNGRSALNDGCVRPPRRSFSTVLSISSPPQCGHLRSTFIFSSFHASQSSVPDPVGRPSPIVISRGLVKYRRGDKEIQEGAELALLTKSNPKRHSHNDKLLSF